MKSIRLVKRGTNRNSKDLELNQSTQANYRERNREIVSTVKGWITELEQRQRRDERLASALLK